MESFSQKLELLLIVDRHSKKKIICKIYTGSYYGIPTTVFVKLVFPMFCS
jgi:hypothetical protein